jgi:hypothetical protein
MSNIFKEELIKLELEAADFKNSLNKFYSTVALGVLSLAVLALALMWVGLPAVSASAWSIPLCVVSALAALFLMRSERLLRRFVVFENLNQLIDKLASALRVMVQYGDTPEEEAKRITKSLYQLKNNIEADALYKVYIELRSDLKRCISNEDLKGFMEEHKLTTKDQ